jgi:hypothetical protein
MDGGGWGILDPEADWTPAYYSKMKFLKLWARYDIRNLAMPNFFSSSQLTQALNTTQHRTHVT